MCKVVGTTSTTTTIAAAAATTTFSLAGLQAWHIYTHGCACAPAPMFNEA